jgi:hypothetical protein
MKLLILSTFLFLSGQVIAASAWTEGVAGNPSVINHVFKRSSASGSLELCNNHKMNNFQCRSGGEDRCQTDVRGQCDLEGRYARYIEYPENYTGERYTFNRSGNGMYIPRPQEVAVSRECTVWEINQYSNGAVQPFLGESSGTNWDKMHHGRTACTNAIAVCEAAKKEGNDCSERELFATVPSVKVPGFFYSEYKGDGDLRTKEISAIALCKDDQRNNRWCFEGSGYICGLCVTTPDFPNIAIYTIVEDFSLPNTYENH